jgi:ssDNA-binding Zn-finger/Zn-ribbon topoisomerase 1
MKKNSAMPNKGKRQYGAKSQHLSISESDNACPKCGGKLMDRPSSGAIKTQLRGCENYPKCKHAERKE